MNLLINASNVRHGGGLSIGLNLLENVLPLRTGDNIYLIHPEGVGYEAFALYPHVTLLPVPETFHHTFLGRIRHNEFIFRAWCRKYNIDKVVSLGNVAFRCDARPQLLYVQNPFLVYPESVAWKSLSWKNFLTISLMDQWASMHLRNATSFAVQTTVMKDRLIKRFELEPDKVHMIPNAAEGKSAPVPMRPPEGKLRLLFLSHWYPRKNFESLLPLAEMIREKSLPVSISITLSRKTEPGSRVFLKEIKTRKLDGVLPNIGAIPRGGIGSTMAAHDGLFLPTLLETFSGAYAEALRCGRPIFTSHYDFAVSALNDAATYFDPLSTDTMYHVLEEAVAHPEALLAKAELASLLGAAMPSWAAIAQRFSATIDTFA